MFNARVQGGTPTRLKTSATKARLYRGKFAKIMAILVILVGPALTVASALPAQAAQPDAKSLMVDVHAGPQTITIDRAPDPFLGEGHGLPPVLPYGHAQDEPIGIALQMMPFEAGRTIRWQTTGTAATAGKASYVHVRVDRKPEAVGGNRGVALSFIIALFTLSATGVMMMWRQVGNQSRPEKPGWERWRR